MSTTLELAGVLREAGVIDKVRGGTIYPGGGGGGGSGCGSLGRRARGHVTPEGMHQAMVTNCWTGNGSWPTLGTRHWH